MKFRYLMILAAVFLLAGCSNKNNQGKKDEAQQVDSCMYAINASATSLEWTAYKFTDKTPVGGKFDRFEVVAAAEKATSLKALFEGLEFTVDPKSINSENPERDPKIIKYFFGVMADSVISGKIKNVVFTGNQGKCEVEVMLNGQKSSILGTFTVEGLQVTLMTELNMNAWNAQDAVTSLNEQCKELHTGPDGLSILWPNIGIRVTSTLNSFNCDNS